MACSSPQAMSALLAAKQKRDPSGWRAFQERVHALKNRRTRARREAEDLEASLFAAQTALRLQSEGALGATAQALRPSMPPDCRACVSPCWPRRHVDLEWHGS